MSIYDKSSLVLIPSGTKTGKVYSQKPVSGDGDFTFTRSSAATRVNADGFIEKETQNLLKQSNQFDTTWLSNGTFTSGQSGYDGTNDAWRFNSDATSMYQITSLVTSGIVTFSVYAKIGSARGIRLRMDESAPVSDSNCYIDLTDGSEIAPHNGIDLDVQSVGSGWYRIAFTHNATNLANVRFYALDAAGLPVVGNIYIQDAQLEYGLVARDYIETTTTAVEGGITDNVPRLDYTDSSCPALLLEPQRSNIVNNSEYVTGYFSQASAVVSYNEIISPEGVQNAFKLTSTTNGQSRIEKSRTVGGTDTYTLSVFLKAGNSNFGSLANFNGGASVRFNLADGTIQGSGGLVDADIIPIGNDGWYRCYMVFQEKVSQTANIYKILVSSDGETYYANNGDYIYGYGAQLELGTYPTSYIPTYGSSVTRTQDNTLNSSAASIIGQTEGSIYAEVDFKAIGEESRFVQLSDGTNSNRFLVGSTSSNGVQIYVVSGGVVQWTPATTPYVDGVIKVAVAYKNNDYAMYVNGTQINTSSSASVPAMDEISVGYNSIVGNRPTAYGHRKVMLFKTRLSNEELAALTTI